MKNQETPTVEIKDEKSRDPPQWKIGQVEIKDENQETPHSGKSVKI
jgi:hypothetical protein